MVTSSRGEAGIRFIVATVIAFGLTVGVSTGLAASVNHAKVPTSGPVVTVTTPQSRPPVRRRAATVPTAHASTRPVHHRGTGGRAPGAVWAALAVCESSGRLHAVDTEPVAGGGTQTVVGLWQIDVKWYASAGLDPYTATRAQQYALALRIYHRQGWRAWPTCGPKVGLR